MQRESDGLTVRFVVTDTAQSIPVVYKGILPDLFKEGKGCVAQGKIGADGVFYADQVLAKHTKTICHRKPDKRSTKRSTYARPARL